MKEQAQSDAFSAEDAFQNEFLAPWTQHILDPSCWCLDAIECKALRTNWKEDTDSQYFSSYAALAQISVGRISRQLVKQNMCRRLRPKASDLAHAVRP